MKYLTIVVPSYNSEAYLNKCVDSLLKGGEDVEIIIVNDGSKDRTGEIANEYQEKYPSIVRAVNKENGGHGSGVNKGMELATGLYFKVVDSDDWVDEEAYKTLLSTIKQHHQENKSPDLYFTNYVFEHIADNRQYVSKKLNRFPVNKFFTFEEMKNYSLDEFTMMHMLVYKLSVLKESKLRLPEKTFYVDNIFTFIPMFYVKTMYYLDINFYRYYVGRADQSVNIENMTKRYDQQLKVMKCMSEAFTYQQLKSLSRKHYKYMMHDLTVKSYLTMFFVMSAPNKEKCLAYKNYFKEFKQDNKNLYYKLRYRTYFGLSNLMPYHIKTLSVRRGYAKMCKRTLWG